MTNPRSRRSELATPASNEHMCEAAARAGADLVFLDLEDACAPSAKESARATAVSALTGLDWGRTVRAVRVNGIDTPWCHDDVIDIVTGARDAIDVIIVPKARSARDVWWVDVLLTQLEAKLGIERPIAIEALIEEAQGLVNVPRSLAQARDWRLSSSGRVICPLRCGPASTATSSRRATILVTSGITPGCRC